MVKICLWAYFDDIKNFQFDIKEMEIDMPAMGKITGSQETGNLGWQFNVWVGLLSISSNPKSDINKTKPVS
jgi:hypothetical protein